MSLSDQRGLAKLPIDVLLNIFDGCDVVDILSLGLVSKPKSNQRLESHPRSLQCPRLAKNFPQLRKNVMYGSTNSSGAVWHFDKLHFTLERGSYMRILPPS